MSNTGSGGDIREITDAEIEQEIEEARTLEEMVAMEKLKRWRRDKPKQWETHEWHAKSREAVLRRLVETQTATINGLRTVVARLQKRLDKISRIAGDD